MRLLVSLFQLHRDLGTEMPWNLSLHTPDNTYSYTPVPVMRGLQGCSLPLLYESPAVEFTDGDRAKCNPISAGINHTVPLFGCTICLKQHWFGGECRKKKKWRRRIGGGPNVCIKDYKNNTKWIFFFSQVHFFLANTYTDSWAQLVIRWKCLSLNVCIKSCECGIHKWLYTDTGSFISKLKIIKVMTVWWLISNWHFHPSHCCE